MADIIPLSGDRHRETLELLPWYVTGSIEPADRVKVETHLGDCALCRAELASERKLREEVTALPLDAGLSFAHFRQRLELPVDLPSVDLPPIPAQRRPAPRWRSMLRAPTRKGWVIAAQAATGMLVVWLAFPALHRQDNPAAAYHTLGSAPTHRAGNLLVMFRPDTQEAQIRALVTQSDARLVDGPTAVGGYVLDVSGARRAAALTYLRGQPAVTLAQPIDQGPPS